MNESRFPQIFAGCLALGLSLILAAWISGQAVLGFKNAENTISVTGSAREAIRSDFATWNATVSAERPTRAEAYTALQSEIEKVQNYLIDEQKLPGGALKKGRLSSVALPEYLPNGKTSGRFRAYRLSQDFEVKLDDVERIEKLAQSSMELIQRGLAFQSHPPQFLYTKLADLRVKMLAQATADARSRAEQIVKNAGSQLGSVRAVRTGVFQITRPHSTEVSDYGMYDTSTIDKDITAVLTMTFGVK